MHVNLFSGLMHVIGVLSLLFPFDNSLHAHVCENAHKQALQQCGRQNLLSVDLMFIFMPQPSPCHSYDQLLPRGLLL